MSLHANPAPSRAREREEVKQAFVALPPPRRSGSRPRSGGSSRQHTRLVPYVVPTCLPAAAMSPTLLYYSTLLFVCYG